MKAVLDDLREPACALGAVRAGNALRPPRRAGGIELDRGLVLVEVERARVFLRADELAYLVRLPDHDRGSAVSDAVLEIRLGDTG